MGRDESDSSKVFFYGVSSGIQYRYTYQLNLDASIVNLTEVMTLANPSLDGIYLTLKVSSNYFIVSCSDCSVPSVQIMKDDFSPLTNYTMYARNNDSISLATIMSST